MCDCWLILCDSSNFKTKWTSWNELLHQGFVCRKIIADWHVVMVTCVEVGLVHWLFHFTDLSVDPPFQICAVLFQIWLQFLWFIAKLWSAHEIYLIFGGNILCGPSPDLSSGHLEFNCMDIIESISHDLSYPIRFQKPIIYFLELCFVQTCKVFFHIYWF